MYEYLMMNKSEGEEERRW